AGAAPAGRASAGLAERLLSGVAAGSVVGAVALGGDVTFAGDTVTGDAGVVISGHLADVLLVPVGDDIALVERAAGGVTVTVPANLDQSRRAARVRPARAVFAAEAIGIATETTQQAAEYAKVRVQFGRPIATFQAVKHHCANMLVAAELATAATWDAGRAADAADRVGGGDDQFSYTAAIAATLAIAAAAGNAS